MFGDDEKGSGGPPRMVFGFMPPPIQQESYEDERMKMDPALAKEFANAKLRNMHANARLQETTVMLRGLEEMRTAMQLFTVGTGDTGSSARPPFEVAFYEENRGKLQNAYLRLTERYLNYCEHMLVQQLDIPVTNEIRKVAEKKAEISPAIPPAEEKKTRIKKS
jgi:hypothetical protein